MQPTPSPGRARFWRRFLAVLIDVIGISAIFALLGVLLFEPTGGRVRTASTIVDVATCSRISAKPPELVPPRGFNVNVVAHCTHYVFGIVHDRTLILGEQTRSGSITTTRTIRYPVDADGQLISILYLDHILVLALTSYFLILEWCFGQTVGKRLLGIRVRSVAGGPLSFSQSMRRMLVRFLPVYPLLPLLVIDVLRTTMLVSTDASLFLWLIVVSICLFVACQVNFILAARRGRLPWHDRWAKTEVVQTGKWDRSPSGSLDTDIGTLPPRVA